MSISQKEEIKNELSKVIESLRTMEEQFYTSAVITEGDLTKRNILTKIRESCYLLGQILREIERL